VFGKAWPTNIATSAEIARNTIAAAAMRSIAAGDNEEDDDRPSGVCPAALDLEGRPIRGMGGCRISQCHSLNTTALAAVISSST
jgi:hypothetical protein